MLASYRHCYRVWLRAVFPKSGDSEASKEMQRRSSHNLDRARKKLEEQLGCKEACKLMCTIHKEEKFLYRL